MPASRIGRRGFLSGLGGAVALAGLPGASRAQPLHLEFWVAGARYHAPRNFSGRAGDPVEIRRSSHRGRPCFEVRCGSAGRIGYVPAELVAVLQAGRCRGAALDLVAPHRPVTRRYRVRMELEMA